ncbi:MAG: helix-turn-helix transcriptional regulator [Ruminococcus sp.]|nr:helix-turn-helix transcriptional regulator [Ruminococcus sp.]
MTFGDFIKAKREEKMMSQRSFAALLGLSPVYVSYFESGKRNPPKRELLLKISEVLHLDSRDTDTMLYLAAQQKYHEDTPDDIIGYVCSNDYAKNALRVAKECRITDEDWDFFTNYIYNKYY